jgi:hypothetical protein
MMLAIIASFLASCSTTKRNRGITFKFLQEHPQEAADYCGNEYPPKVTPGKDSIVHDTTITPGKQIECPPVVIKTEKGKDSLVYRYVTCPPDTSTKTIKTRVDTIENTAKIYSLQFDRDSLINLANVRTTERDKAQKQAVTRLIWLFGLIGLVVIAVVLKLKRII